MSVDRKRLTETSVPPAIVSTSRRSAFDETRSCSTKRRRKRRTSRRLRMIDDVGDVGGGSLGIVAEHELREHLLERAGARQPLQRLHRVVGDDPALVNDDDA